MVVRLKTDKIGLKNSVNVHANLTNVDKADEMMIALLSLNAAMEEADQSTGSEDSMNQTLVMLKKEREFVQRSLKFLQDVLKLSDKQLGVVKDHIDFKVLGEYLSYVCNRIKGVPEAAYEKEQAKAGPKGRSASSDGQ